MKLLCFHFMLTWSSLSCAAPATLLFLVLCYAAFKLSCIVFSPFCFVFSFFFGGRWKKFEFLLDFVDNIMYWSLGAWWLLHTWMASRWCLCNAIYWLLIKEDIFVKNCEESYFETGPLKATNHLWSSCQSYFWCLIVLFDLKPGCCLKCHKRTRGKCHDCRHHTELQQISCRV